MDLQTISHIPVDLPFVSSMGASLIGDGMLLLAWGEQEARQVKVILFMDDVGAEYTQVFVTRKEVRYAHGTQLIRFRPVSITPLEVMKSTSSARRAAGGFLLAGPIGAAIGLLVGNGPKVLFELALDDGSVRRGLILQRDYGLLRVRIERMHTYQPLSFKRVMRVAVWLLTLTAFVAALGPVGIPVAIAVDVAVRYLLRRARRSSVEAVA